MEKFLKRKILMFGRGAVSALYGWAFTKTGHSVEYFVRPNRAKEYGEFLPVRILDARRKIQGELVSETMPTRLRDTLPAEHDFDLIIVSVQHYNFEEAADFLASRVGNATVLVLGNFWKEPALAAAALPAAQLAWGFPGAGGGFPDGVLHGVLFKSVSLGTRQASPTARESGVRELFRQSGFGVAELSDLRGWLLVHFVMNGGLHAQNLLAGSFIRLMQSGAHRRNAIRNMRELLPLLTARGVDMRKRRAEMTLIKLPAWIGGMVLGLAWTFHGPMRLAISSHTTPNEILFTCRDLLQDAQARGIPTPRLASAVAHAQKLLE